MKEKSGDFLETKKKMRGMFLLVFSWFDCFFCATLSQWLTEPQCQGTDVSACVLGQLLFAQAVLPLSKSSSQTRYLCLVV
jgi:hypothetical protein